VDGYSYAEFCAAVEKLHGQTCWVQTLLRAREARLSPGLYGCAGITDGHHLTPKALLKREFPHGIDLNDDGEIRATAAVWRAQDAWPSVRPLGVLLNDGRNGAPVCRRHHDMVEGRLIRIARAELPAEAEAFAKEIGLGWALDRTFGARA
jgi:hypothetical protein